MSLGANTTLSPQICCRRRFSPFQNFCFQRRAYFRLEKGKFLLNICFQIPEIFSQIFGRNDPTSSEASSVLGCRALAPFLNRPFRAVQLAHYIPCSLASAMVARSRGGNMVLFIVSSPTLLLRLLLLLLVSSCSAAVHLAFSPVMKGFPQQRHRVSMAVNPEDVEGYQKDTKAVKAGYKGSGWSSDPLGRR